MNTDRFTRRVALVIGGGAIITMGAFTAGCSSSEKPAPSSTTTTTTTSSVTPTEKSITPGGANSFSPPVKAPPAPTGEPGTHRNGSSS